MKAAVLRDWQNIIVEDVEIPKLEEGHALIEVGLGGICGSDVHIYNGHNAIATRPVIQGHEFMGVLVDHRGPLPSGVSIGDRVVVHPLVSCGQCRPCLTGIEHVCENLIVIGVNRNGAFAQYVSVPTKKVLPVPDGLPDDVAVLTEPFAVGFHCLQRVGLNAGEAVLVTGGGPIGHYAALVARHLGARHVVVSEPIAGRRDVIQSFGLDTVDPSQADGLDIAREQSGGNGFEVVVETSGVDAGINFALDAAAVQGRIASLGFPTQQVASYNVTRTIIKELSFIGSRVYPLAEFRQTVSVLENMHQSGSVDFRKILGTPRDLEGLAHAIEDVEQGKENKKVTISPQ